MDRIRERLSDAVLVIAVACAITVTALVARRELLPPGRRIPLMVEQGPVSISDWPQVSSRGHHLGSARQGINVVVFSDFECPACRRFAVETLPVIERRFGAQITVLFRHWPLRQHRFAYSAARAAECAARQGRFRAFHDAVFRQQDSLGLKSYADFARDSDIPELGAFTRCVAENGLVPSIETDIREVKRIGGIGTPTVVVEGRMLREAADSVHVAALINIALKERREE